MLPSDWPSWSIVVASTAEKGCLSPSGLQAPRGAASQMRPGDQDAPRREQRNVRIIVPMQRTLCMHRQSSRSQHRMQQASLAALRAPASGGQPDAGGTRKPSPSCLFAEAQPRAGVRGGVRGGSGCGFQLLLPTAAIASLLQPRTDASCRDSDNALGLESGFELPPSQQLQPSGSCSWSRLHGHVLVMHPARRCRHASSHAMPSCWPHWHSLRRPPRAFLSRRLRLHSPRRAPRASFSRRPAPSPRGRAHNTVAAPSACAEAKTTAQRDPPCGLLPPLSPRLSAPGAANECASTSRLASGLARVCLSGPAATLWRWCTPRRCRHNTRRRAPSAAMRVLFTPTVCWKMERQLGTCANSWRVTACWSQTRKAIRVRSR